MKQIERGNLKLLGEKVNLVHCKPSQCKVLTSTKDLAHGRRDLTLSTDIY